MTLLAALDRAWTRVEVGLCAAVTAALTLALVSWVALKGLSARTTDTFIAGLVFRALAGALMLGVLARLIGRRLPARASRALTWGALLLGAGAAWLWRDGGVAWATNLLGWLQEGSSLTLVGGLRGLGTRLTLWLALLGGSLATATGRHVSIDVATRALGPRAGAALAKAGAAVAAAVCLVVAWGFFDFTAVDAFGAPLDAPVGAKVSHVARGLSRHAFIARRQLALDARMLPRVLAGGPWDKSLTGEEWNRWLAAGNWGAHFTPEQVQALQDPDPANVRVPLATVPGESARGLLVKTLNLIIPFGLVVLALRFLLWLLRGAQAAGAHGAQVPA